jgi:branched-chain amino acid aminotransferase
VALDELCGSRSFSEAFACGTAAGVTPISAIRWTTGDWPVGDGEPGMVTIRLRRALAELQEGRAGDPSGWRVEVSDGRSPACARAS